jgi:hypothetical protein
MRGLSKQVSQMRWAGRALAAGALCLLMSGCIGMRTEITRERGLLAADKAFAQMSLDQGASVALTAMMAPNNSMLARPEGEYIGAAQAAAAYPAPFAGAQDVLYWDPDRAWISADDTLGVTSGRFVRTRNGIAREQGRYVTVWRRDEAGAWKADLALSNNDAPGVASSLPLTQGPTGPLPAPYTWPQQSPAPTPAPYTWPQQAPAPTPAPYTWPQPTPAPTPKPYEFPPLPSRR